VEDKNMTNLDSHQTHCLINAAYFTAVRGRNPANRLRVEFSNIEDAKAYGASFGDGRTMIYAVTNCGQADLIMNS
jgi:hypothetical protein